jgi:hypothetical protein
MWGKVISVLFCCKLSRFTEVGILMARTRLQRLPTVNGTELQIVAKKDWGSLIFTPVWLAFWTFGGIMVMKWLIHPGPSTPRAFLSLWLTFWLLGEV